MLPAKNPQSIAPKTLVANNTSSLASTPALSTKIDLAGSGAKLKPVRDSTKATATASVLTATMSVSPVQKSPVKPGKSTATAAGIAAQTARNRIASTSTSKAPNPTVVNGAPTSGSR